MCPRCSGTIVDDFEEPSCINCGFIQFSAYTLAHSHREMKRGSVRGPGSSRLLTDTPTEDGRKGRRAERYRTVVRGAA